MLLNLPNAAHFWVHTTTKTKKLSLEFQFGDNLIISPLNTYNFDTIGTNKFKFLHFFCFFILLFWRKLALFWDQRTLFDEKYENNILMLDPKFKKLSLELWYLHFEAWYICFYFTLIFILFSSSFQGLTTKKIGPFNQGTLK